MSIVETFRGSHRNLKLMEKGILDKVPLFFFSTNYYTENPGLTTECGH